MSLILFVFIEKLHNKLFYSYSSKRYTFGKGLNLFFNPFSNVRDIDFCGGGGGGIDPVEICVHESTPSQILRFSFFACLFVFARVE